MESKDIGHVRDESVLAERRVDMRTVGDLVRDDERVDSGLVIERGIKFEIQELRVRKDGCVGNVPGPCVVTWGSGFEAGRLRCTKGRRKARAYETWIIVVPVKILKTSS